MKYALLTPEGEIFQTGYAPSEGDIEAQGGPEILSLPCPEDVSDTTHYLKDGEFKTYPTKPDVWAKFDFDRGEWLDPRDDAAKADQFRAAQERATSEINGLIGRSRALFVTDAPGQEMVYLAKQAEAREAVALGGKPKNPEEFPFLLAEVGATGDSLHEVAQVVLNTAHQWSQIGSALEGLRMAAIFQVHLATTESSLGGVIGDLRESLNALLLSVGKNGF